MNDTDRTCAGLFVISCAFWLLASGFGLQSLTQTAEDANAQHGEQFESIVAAK